MSGSVKTGGRSRLGRILRKLITWACLAALVLGLLVGLGWWYHHPKVATIERVVYGQRAGIDLTFDRIQPRKPNGKAVLVMNSGSWKSKKDDFKAWLVAPLLRSGFTVFGISHISQPKVSIMDTVADVQRATRFIRHHARKYEIDPNALGVTGGSSGGHLSLCLATLGGPGELTALDPVERESSAVQAVAVFFPVTDLLNLGDSTENAGDGGPPKSYVKGFGPDSKNLKKWKQIGGGISPIFHIKKNLAPILIYHGDADTLVPIDQSTRFIEEAEKIGAVPPELVVRKGKGHGWPRILLDIHHFAAWFETHL
ncbi:MAG: alpha/beta hydrolase [Verrucomicrobiales bacterium]|nr:alpha/beta hydrolase [Verrucomicrobiales bacterium]